MNSEQFQRLKETFQALLDASAEERALAVEGLRHQEPEIAVALDAWLRSAAENEGRWLDVPAIRGLDDGQATHDSQVPAAAANGAPERIGPWVLEAEIGRGGMGTVYRARRDDGAFAQTVAIKLVRPELASEVLRQRFLAERRILAGLVHPNIAHLVDGGATPEGVPYLVLEHVAGEPIDRYCDRQALSVQARLRLFAVVCGAVDFAHRKLVLHRDIKTANVLVDANGAPKLLDFGIAKLLEPTAEGADLTALGAARPLTIEWASPEQLRGLPLTTASDVYSLGVLLHVLLTGRRPHRFSGQGPDAFAREIEQRGVRLRGEEGSAPSLPAGVEARRLRGDLQRIVERALAPDSAERYGSAAELAADVERHLAGLPVLAHPASWGYRFAKFARRHRAAVAAAAIAIASLLAATGVSLRQARVAERERARAERRFADVRRLANVLLFDVHTALDNVAGSMVARRLLVDNALRYLDDLAAEAHDDPALTAELAVAYERIGEIQGMPGWPSEGRTGDALASFERALEHRRRGLAIAPGGAPATGPRPSDADEARLLMRIGSVLAARGDIREALARHRQALALLAALAASATGASPPALAGVGVNPPALASSPRADTAMGLELARAQVAVGDDVWELGDVKAAAEVYRDALHTSRATAAADPQSTQAARQVGVVEQRLGDAAFEIGAWAEALEHHTASLAVDRELAARQPDDVETRRDLGCDLSRLGVDQANQGAAAEALELHLQASALRQQLLREEPQDVRAAEDLAESRLEAGKAYAALGRHREADREIAQAIDLWRALCAKDPHNTRWVHVLAGGMTTRAEVEAQRGDSIAAAATRAEVVAMRRQLLRASPEFAANRVALAALERQPGATPPRQ